MKKLLLVFIALGMLIACSEKKEKKYAGKPVKLEFHETYFMQEIEFYWRQAVELMDAKQAFPASDENDLMSHETNSLLSLSALVRPCGDFAIGYVKEQDMAAVDSIMAIREVKELFPPDLKYMWSLKPEDQARTGGELYYILYAIKLPETRKKTFTGKYIKDASVGLDESNGIVTIDLVMNEKGSDLWAQMTEDNINRCIAMSIDGRVVCAPRVMAAITGGSTQISGSFTLQEAEDLAGGIMAGTRN